MTLRALVALAAVLALVGVGALAACPKQVDAPPSADAGVVRSADAGVVAPAAASPPSGAPEVVVFATGNGWSGGRTCTDVRPEDGCDSQWLHSSGQVARVFIVDVKDERALKTFVDKLAADVGKQGGVVDRFMQAGLTLVRFLQPMTDEKGQKLASINYALVGRDNKAVFLITTVVTFDDQRAADERLRALLDTAAWTPRTAP